jgi:hypothetical protein
MPALTSPKTAVTVSIIFKLPSQRVRQNDWSLAQSKRFKGRQRDGGTVRFYRNTLSRSGTTKPVFQREKRATIDSPRNSCPHFRRVRVALWSLSDAEVGRIGVVAAGGSKSSKQPGGMVVWGRWGFGGQIRFAGRRVVRLS